METEQMMQRLLAEIRTNREEMTRLDAKMDAWLEEMKARRKE
jgi:hypothetical protein